MRWQMLFILPTLYSCSNQAIFLSTLEQVCAVQRGLGRFEGNRIYMSPQSCTDAEVHVVLVD